MKYTALITTLVIIVGMTYLILNSRPEVKLLNSYEFENTLADENVFLINTHTPYMGEIEGTDLIAENWENMDYYKDKLPKDRNTPIAVYCRSGRMSAVASKQLLDMGYKNVYELAGGMDIWQASGKNLIIKKY